MPTTFPLPAPAEIAAHLARVALGDRQAFRALYDATAPRLLGTILRIQRQRDTAEDVLQEVYLKVWDAAGGYQASRAKPFTWLQAIARNSAIDSLRRQQTEPESFVPLPIHSEGSHPAAEEDAHPLAHLPSPEPGPAELLEQAWDASDVRGCMAQLESPQRHSLALAFYDGLSHAEVAHHLGQPLGTVKSWLRRSLQALQRCLAACGHTGASAATRA